jgi:pSer/pThr/pTyr-binding forkhead associated (FHA) protein
MEKHDPFKEKTVTYNQDEEVIVVKNANIYTKGLPRLEAHGKSKTLSNKAFGIGRDKSNAVIILDGKISKFHAVITFKNGIVFIRDCNSKNGTFLNGTRIPTNKNVELKDKDKVSLGNTEIVFYC